MTEDTAVISKSAKKRANKKANEAKAAEEEEAETPAPAPKAKANAAVAATATSVPVQAAQPKAKAKAQATTAANSVPAAQPKATPETKAKAQTKAKADAAPPSPPAPEPKAKPKAKAKVEPVLAPAPAAPKVEEKAEPKAKAKSKAGATQNVPAKAAPKKEEEVEEKKTIEELIPTYIDDGTGPEWETSDGVSKKQKRRTERIEEDKKLMTMAKAQGLTGNKHIAGAVFDALAGQRIPGMEPAGATKAAVSQSVNAASGAAKEAAAPKPETSTATIKVPDNKVGIVIGPKGAKIKLIQEKTGTRIDTSGEVFTVTGPPQGVATAEYAIRDLITKGYTNLAFDDFAENFVMVPKESLPDLIGKKGAIVIAMKDGLGVEVSFPDTANIKDGKKCKVTIAGSVQKVEKAKEVISDILMFGHHEVTHPGYTHEEIEVPEWAYSAVIGKKGCELRHIQNSYKVKVNIPREGSLNQNVVLVGESAGVPKAKAYVERLVANFSNQAKGRGREDKADDGWGDEGPEEDWMKAYLYKR